MRTDNFEEGFSNLSLENRKKLDLTGVTDVDSFDEKKILLYTQLGELTIQGRNLHINAINVETGKMSIEGDIYSVVYGEKSKTKQLGFLAKLVK